MHDGTRPSPRDGEEPRITARPTMYEGCRFRSRLEARWAAFFDLVGWRWEYEPLELAGYIPDFILMLPHAPLLVEVKPALTVGEMEEHTAKIEASGWDGEALIVGASLSVRSGWSHMLGLMAERMDDGEWSWDEAHVHWCPKCSSVSFHHSVQSYRCRVGGCYDGDRYLWPVPEQSVEMLWRKTGNVTQWRAA